MLRLVIRNNELSFPWRSLRSANINFRRLHYYRIDEDCLRQPWESSRNTSKTTAGIAFQVLSERFGAPLVHGDFAPSIRCLINTLRTARARPEFKRDEGKPMFSVFFDVSSKTHNAYYSLGTVYFGQLLTRITTAVYCTHATPEIIENIRHLDETLHSLIQLCNIPQIRK